MNATVLSSLADSGLFMAGNQIVDHSEFLKLLPGEDDDAHVLAFEEWDQRCMCCCCTGECRRGDAYEFSFEDALFAGFAEGDLTPAGCPCQGLLEGWSSCEDCLPGCASFMGERSVPPACWF